MQICEHVHGLYLLELSERNSSRPRIRSSRTHARTRLSGCGHDRKYSALACSVTEDGLGLVLLQRGSFFDDRISNIRSAFFENQASVLQFLWITPSSIGPKLIKAALDY